MFAMRAYGKCVCLWRVCCADACARELLSSQRIGHARTHTHTRFDSNTENVPRIRTRVCVCCVMCCYVVCCAMLCCASVVPWISVYFIKTPKAQMRVGSIAAARCAVLRVSKRWIVVVVMRVCEHARWMCTVHTPVSGTQRWCARVRVRDTLVCAI